MKPTQLIKPFSRFIAALAAVFVMLVPVMGWGQNLTINTTTSGTSYTSSSYSCGGTVSGSITADGQNMWICICPPAGQYLQLNFTSINLENAAGSTNDDYLIVYQGCGLGGTVLYAPQPSNGVTQTVTASAPDICMTVRIAERGSFGASGSITATINCLSPPSNDEPCNATILTGTGTSCSSVSGTNVLASGTTSEMAPWDVTNYDVCGSYSTGDVWYQVTVPATGVVNVDVAGTGMDYANMAWYIGSCSNLQQIDCVENTAGTTATASNTMPLVPGSTVWIRVWSYTEDTGTFNICAYTNTNTSQIVPGSTALASCPSSLSFYDPGGSGSNYGNDQASVYKICPPLTSPVSYVSVAFTGNLVLGTGDHLIVLNGGYVSAPVITDYTGTSTPGTITSSALDGCLTFVFNSDNSTAAAGWNATVSCTTTPGTNTIICNEQNCNGGCGQTICGTGTVPYQWSTTGNSSVEEIVDFSQGCMGNGELNPVWFYFHAATSGNIEILFDGSVDFDFAVWQSSVDGTIECPLNSLEEPIRCSWAAGNNIQPSGMQNGSGDLWDGTGGALNSVVEDLDATAGDTYVMLLNLYSPSTPQPKVDFVFGGSALLDCTPLSVELIDFTGINQGRTNLLMWKTISEYNNDFFTLERSRDVENWIEVGNIDGMGTTKQTTYYELRDNSPHLPISYYRLKQTDFDGKVKYSKILTLSSIPTVVDFMTDIFPNPGENYFTLQYGGHDSANPLTINVFDEVGKIVLSESFEKVKKNQAFTFDITHLAEGVYQVVSSQDGNINSQRLVKIIGK